MTAADYLKTASEADFKDTVVGLAQHLGWWVHHDRPARRGDGGWTTHIQGNPGVPDLVMVNEDGVVFYLELKSEKGVISADQKQWLARLSHGRWSTSDLVVFVEDDTGHVMRIVGVARPSNIGGIRKLLERDYA